MLKKIIALLLALVMVVGMCACAAKTETPAADAPAADAPAADAPAADAPAADAPAADAPAADAPAADAPAAPEKDDEPIEFLNPEPTGRTIGANQLMMGVYALDVPTAFGRQVTDLCGDEIIVVNDEGNMEKMVADVENYVSAGVDAIFWTGFAENNFQVGPHKAEAGGVPIALPIFLPRDPTVSEEIMNMEMFAGGVGSNDTVAGQQVAEWALAQGAKAAVVGAGAIGDTVIDRRVEGFISTFEAGGGTILQVSRAAGSGSDTNAQVDNLISSNPDLDLFFGATSDYGLAAVNVLTTYGMLDDVYVTCLDANPELLEYVRDGRIDLIGALNQICAYFTMIMLENYLDGFPMVSEDSGRIEMIRGLPPFLVSAKTADLFEEHFINNFMFEEDETKALLYRFNPNVTLDDLIYEIENLSVEGRLIAKYKAGKVTAAELEAAGIAVP